MYKDLRGYLDLLDKHGQLLKYTDEILPEPDVTLLTCGTYSLGRDCPAILMDNVKGYKGKRLATNVHGSWANFALAIGEKPDSSVLELFRVMDKLYDKYPGEITQVTSPPCQEVVLTDFNLLEFIPLFKVNNHDGAFYLTKSFGVTRDPDDPDNDETENLTIFLMGVLDKDTIVLQAMYNPHIIKAEERGENLPIAICIGNDPIVSSVACSVVLPGEKHYKKAASLKQQPLELTKTTDGKLNIPAGTEIVLEGEVSARKRIPGGPAGEFLGSYSDVRLLYEVKIHKVTHRKDPIFENLYSGERPNEMETLIGLTSSVPMYREVKQAMPEVTAVNALPSFGLTVIMSVTPRFGGYAKSVAMRLASTEYGSWFARNIILVDGDVDPFDLNQVMWAMSTRLRKQDVVVIPSTVGMSLNPVSDPPGMDVKIIYDATTPVHPDKILRDSKMTGKMPEAETYGKKVMEMLKKQRGLR